MRYCFILTLCNIWYINDIQTKNQTLWSYFLIWLGLVCCGVANGLVYDHVQAPQSYYYMVIPSIIAVIMLIIHRVYTRNWHDEDHHSSVFSGSAVIFFIVTLSSLFAVHTGEVSWGFFVACMTMLLSFCIATIKERSYV